MAVLDDLAGQCLIALFVAAILFIPAPFLIDVRAGQNLASALRNTALIAAAVSSLLYLASFFMRLSISSYHLARDARERLQLTHVFLALIKDGAVDPKDREVVLQAVFSRADTGLLKGDSSPTMPGVLGSVLELRK